VSSGTRSGLRAGVALEEPGEGAYCPLHGAGAQAGREGRTTSRGRSGSGGVGNPAGDVAALSVLLALAFVAALFRVCDYDVWWHVRTGDLVLGSASIPRTDPFSHLVQGRPWMAHSWASDVLIALAARAGGLEAVTLAKCAATVLLAATLWTLARRAGASAPASFVAVALALATARFRLFERPHLAGFLILPVVLEALARAAERRAVPPRRRDLLLPVLFLLWANLHVGFTLGLLLFPVALAAAAARRAWGVEGDARAARRRLLELFAASALATLANPHGARVHTYPLLAEGTLSEMRNVEWLAPRPALFPLFFVWLALLVASAPLARRAGATTRLLLLLPLAALALRSNRSIGEFAVGAAVPSALLATRAAARLGPMLARRRVHVPGAAVALAVAGVLAILHARGVLAPGGAYRFGLGIQDDLFPREAADYVEDRALAGNMANTPAFGGYLIWRFWPARLVLADGRADLYRDAAAEIAREGWNRSLDRLGITYAIARTDPGPSSDPLLQAVATARDWHLVYWDDVASVWARRTPAHEAAIAQDAFRVADPWRDAVDVPPDSLALAAAEYARAAATSHPFRALRGLGIARLRTKDVAGAEEAFARAADLRPGDPPAWMLLAYARLVAGRPADALAPARRAVRLAPDDPLALRHLGVALFDLERYDEALRPLERAATRAPANPEIAAYLRECRARGGGAAGRAP
jgi:tetratricopeptide (TPR) repeat protein